MTARARLTSRARLGLLAALLVALVPLASYRRVSHGHATIASEGLIGGPLLPDGSRASIRRKLVERAAGTYIDEILAERDSALSHWGERDGDPLDVWIQSASPVSGWNDAYSDDVRDAFAQWNSVHLPVRFTFTSDSAAADIHVTFVHHFDEEISGRTRWTRDDSWQITGGDISLAVFHRSGPMLDDDAMHAMAMHEVGHLLGLDHTRDSTSIMAARVRVRALSRADRATAHLLYSLPPGGVR